MQLSPGPMNHKRGKPKSSRAGCLLCKPHKHQRCAKKARLAAKKRLRNEEHTGS